MRLIDANLLTQAITDTCRNKTECINHFWYDEHIIALIENAPTVEERHHEEWQIHGLCFECPTCHCGCMFTIVDKIVYGHLNFCPNCGADMRGDKE